VAALGGAEVYKALGAEANISYWSDIQDGTHRAIRPEWTTPFQQNIKKFLEKTGNDSGVFRISPLALGPHRRADPLDRTAHHSRIDAADDSATHDGAAEHHASEYCAAQHDATDHSGGGRLLSVGGGEPVAGRGLGQCERARGAAAIQGWTVTMSLPSGATVTNTWNATPSGTARCSSPT
jgi:hypothetical protein